MAGRLQWDSAAVVVSCIILVSASERSRFVSVKSGPMGLPQAAPRQKRGTKRARKRGRRMVKRCRTIIVVMQSEEIDDVRLVQRLSSKVREFIP